MTNPLPTPKPEPVVKEGRDRVPYAEYVRVVEFPDRNPPGPDDAPVHVLCAPVLFDGVMAPAAIAKEGITVDVGDGGTIVTLHVLAEDVQVGSTDPEEEFVPHLIGGRHVLTPVGEGWDWVPVDPDRPEGYIACSIYVAEVHVR